MMTDKQILALPKKAANRAEVDAMYYLDAFAKQLQEIAGGLTADEVFARIKAHAESKRRMQ